MAGVNLVLFLDTEVSKAALITGSSGNRVANDLLKIQAPGLKTIWPSFLGCPECLRAAISQITRPSPIRLKFCFVLGGGG